MESTSTSSLRVTQLNLPQSVATFLNSNSTSKAVVKPDIVSATSWTNEQGNGVLYLSTWTQKNGWEIENSTVTKGSTTSMAGSSASNGISIVVNGTDKGVLNLNVIQKEFDDVKSIKAIETWEPPRSQETQSAVLGIDVFEDYNRIASVSEGGALDLAVVRPSGFSTPWSNSTTSCAAYNDVKFLKNPNKIIVVGNKPKTDLEVWDVLASNHAPVQTLTSSSSNDNNSYGNNCICTHPTRPEIVVTGQSTGGIKVWDIRKQNTPLLKSLIGHTLDVWDLKFHPQNPSLLFSVGHDGNILRWNISGYTALSESSNSNSSMLVDPTVINNNGNMAIESLNLSYDILCSSNGVVGNSIDISGMTGSMVAAYDDGCLICCDDVETL
jgi:WD40 repeat protein